MFYLNRRYPKGHIFFEEGTVGTLAYIVKTGRVKVTKRDGDGHIVLAIFERGEIFGEMALLGADTRTATAKAIEETEAVSISRKHLLMMLQKAEPILKALVLSFVNRLKRTTDSVHESLIVETEPEAQATTSAADGQAEDLPPGDI